MGNFPSSNRTTASSTVLEGARRLSHYIHPAGARHVPHDTLTSIQNPLFLSDLIYFFGSRKNKISQKKTPYYYVENRPLWMGGWEIFSDTSHGS